jgi:predicted outer membrane protein
MDRRTFATTMMMGAVGLTAAPVLAQSGARMGAMPMGPAEQRHAMDTLMVGAVALESSRLAQSRARNPMVQEFARFETEEQTTVAQIINEMTGMAPPPPAPNDRRAMERLMAARGAAFDREYIMAQMDGHRRLLAIQERYISEGRNPHNRHIALLARGRIQEHLRDLDKLQRMRG